MGVRKADRSQCAFYKLSIECILTDGMEVTMNSPIAENLSRLRAVKGLSQEALLTEPG